LLGLSSLAPLYPSRSANATAPAPRVRRDRLPEWIPRALVGHVVNDPTDPDGLSPAQRRAAQELIGKERARTVRLIDSLMRQWDGIVEASALTIHDDEHDPEGATIAFERAQVEAMLRRARVDLEDLDRAAKRILTGDYRVCERCGATISPDRLTARPATRTCITCANKVAR
jgi:DnaK suppressor protein